MARERDPFGLALMHLREDLRDGRIPPGAPLTTADLALRLQISATPIREALSRLAGEGLVEDHRGRGVFALRYEVSELEALYRLHASYVGLMLELPTTRRRLARDGVKLAATGDDVRSLRDRCEAFWRVIVDEDQGGMIAQAHQRVTDQLARARLAEPRVLDDLTVELDGLVHLAREAESPAFRTAIAGYHQRRQDEVRALAAALRTVQPGEPI